MKTKKNSPTRSSFILSPLWQVIYDRLDECLPEEAMREWVDHFELISFTRKKIVLLLDSDANLQVFREKYGEIMEECVAQALHRSVPVTYKQKRPRSQRRAKLARRAGLLLLSLLFLGASALVAVFGVNFLTNRSFQETFYQVSSGKVSGNLRIIQLSDLHSTVFDGDNGELVRRIGLLSPDLIVMTGDCVEQSDRGYDVTLELCKRLVEIAPVYYIYGNDETTRAFDVDMTLTSIGRWGSGGRRRCRRRRGRRSRSSRRLWRRGRG